MNIQIIALTDEQRLIAKEQARKIVVQGYGTEPSLEQFQRPLPALPSREDYENRTISDYPSWVSKIIAIFMGIVFVAAALPSLFRLYTVGRDYFLLGINDHIQASIVGLSTFLLAEFLIVLSTVAMRVLFKSNLARALFAIPIVLGMAMAFVGNWTIVQPHHMAVETVESSTAEGSPTDSKASNIHKNIYMAWLETLAPPIAVLFTAFIGEQLILHNLKTLQANENAFQLDYSQIERERKSQAEAEKANYRETLRKWQEAVNNPENAEAWLSAYANAIWQQLLISNDSGRGRTERMEYLSSLGRDEKIALVRQQIQSENWFTEKHLSQATERLQDKPQAEKPVEPKPEDYHEYQSGYSESIPVNPTQAPELVPMSSNGNGAHHPNGNR